jgi:DNA-binding LacI/PurR family transcriptional regulator
MIAVEISDLDNPHFAQRVRAIEDAAFRRDYHPIERGHNRIGFIGDPEGIETAAERILGYQHALSAARPQPLTAAGDYRFEGGTRATCDLSDQGAIALLVANNPMAVGALHTIKEAGLRVAADVALISVDDPRWAELTDPPPTTLRQPLRAMAYTAVGLLVGRLERRRKRRKRQVFDSELHHRGSCCQPHIR